MSVHTHQGHNYMGLPSLGSYAEAKKHLESVRPIRGSDNVKPLGRNRRYKWVNIKDGLDCDSNGDPLGVWRPYIACRLGDYDMIKFYQDGGITLDTRCWRGWSIGGLLYFVLKDKVGVVKSHRGKWYFQNKIGTEYAFKPDGSLEMRLDHVDTKTGYPIYVPKEPVVEKRYKLKRKVMNELRKRYKPFTDYASTALAINSQFNKAEADGIKNTLGFDDFTYEPQSQYYWGQMRDDNATRTNITQALDKFINTGDLNLAYSLMYGFAFKAGTYTYNSGDIHCSPKAFNNAFTEFLKYQFKDELFEVEEQAVGTAFKDENIKYVMSSMR